MSKEKILYAENKDQIANLEMSVNYGKGLIENSIAEWNRICPVNTLTLDELHSFIGADPLRLPLPEKVDSLLREKLVTGKKLSFEGIALNAEKLKELLVMPDLTGFIASLSKFKDPIPYKVFAMHDYIYWEYYQIEAGKVQILTEGVESYKNSFREYAETAEEIERLKSILPVCKAMTEFMKLNPKITDCAWISTNLMIYDAEGLFFYPSYAFVKYNRF